MTNKKKIAKITLNILPILIINVLILLYLPNIAGTYSFSYDYNSPNPGKLQLFYSTAADAMSWSEDKSHIIDYTDINSVQTINFKIPSDTLYVRFDFYYQDIDTIISNVALSYQGKSFPLGKDMFVNSNNYSQITYKNHENNSYQFKTLDNDPYIIYQINSSILEGITSQGDKTNSLIKFLICVFLDLSFFLVYKKIRIAIVFVIDLFKNRSLIWSLSKNDFKTKYAGSYLGITWAFIQPIVTTLTYWFVFQFGLKASSPVNDIPFALWFMSGLVPWFFFQEALINGTNCMTEYSYLVKKVVFNINILPVVKIISSFFVHFVFVLFITTIFWVNGIFSGIYTLQLFYYSFCCFFFVLGLSYATASIVVFFKDLGQFIVIILQIFMWMTPIMWSDTILPATFKWFAFVNPIFYVVDGFRDSLITQTWFWEKPLQTMYFWFIAMLMFLFGSTIFKRLKPHFADVL